MLPFAAILAVVAIGQTLVVQQGGIDLSYRACSPVRRRGHQTREQRHTRRDLPGSSRGLSHRCGGRSRLGLRRRAVERGTDRRDPRHECAPHRCDLGGLRGCCTSYPHRTVRCHRIDAARSSGDRGRRDRPDRRRGVVVRLTPTGRIFEAVGANPRVAVAAGIAPLRYTLGAYSVAAVLYAVAGVLLTGIVNTRESVRATPTCCRRWLPSYSVVHRCSVVKAVCSPR
ncbi:ABC transporter permease subunit [Rhodococcus sp. B7740]|uniref:ABC transporter permease subunit n=1 Tax=Rhodococcus sp. B7740 TaxID=1564114 RepID=UPI003FA7E80C